MATCLENGRQGPHDFGVGSLSAGEGCVPASPVREALLQRQQSHKEGELREKGKRSWGASLCRSHQTETTPCLEGSVSGVCNLPEDPSEQGKKKLKSATGLPTLGAAASSAARRSCK